MSQRKIDSKHSVVCPSSKDEVYVAKRFEDGRLERIPDEEPTILFRGRDKLALPMLRHYRALCEQDGATEYQLAKMDDMIRKFADFADSSPTMKQPGVTRGM